MTLVFLNIIGFIQSFFLGSVLVASSWHGRKSNLLGGLLMLIFAIPIFNSIRILVWGTDFFSEYEWFSNFSLLLIGPLLYLYARLRVLDESFRKRDRWHFLPFAVLLPLQIVSLFFLGQQIAMAIEIFSGLTLVVIMTLYQFLAIRLIFKKSRLVEKPLRFTLYGFAIVWHVNLLIQITEHFSEKVKEEYQIFSTLTLSVLVLILSYTHWFELMKKPNMVKSKIKLDTERSKSIWKKIQTAMLTHRPYLRQDFSLQKFSAQIGEPSSYISHIVNQEMKTSFPKYVASFRIKAFVEKARETESQHFSIQGLSEEVGFRSSSTFIQAFKENMQMLPSEFMRSLKGD